MLAIISCFPVTLYYLLFFFFFNSIWDVSSPTMDQTRNPGSGSSES